MTRQHVLRLRRSAITAAAALTAIAGGIGAAPDAGAATAATPQLHLVAAASSVTLDRYQGDPGVFLDLGTYVTADRAPFELRVTRASYSKPVTVSQVFHDGGRVRTKALPAGLVEDFTGLPGFLQITVAKPSGRKVYEATRSFCPDNPAGRVRPDGPATSAYPLGCSTNPFTLGSVWGIERGWAAGTTDYGDGQLADLPAGDYVATVSVAKKYRALFGMPNERRSIKVTVRTDSGSGGKSLRTARFGAASHMPSPAAERPSGRPAGAKVPTPDLRALPAYGITINDGSDGPAAAAPHKDYLAFSATVWNAGPAPLVVDGFRTPGKPTMDAYQYFYDAKGRQVGYTPTGTMVWDPRVGHQHWHFTDFASYRLLGADRHEVVRSGKEAFCLANTDAVDYTVENADWQPENTDLATACGQENSISVREVLDVGNGDTYTQDRPGQSFDITGLADGTYYIEVVANPDHRLRETSLGNNVTLRKVILGGTTGHRTVTVPPYDLIDAP